jgi:hypothetical protein
MANAATQQPNWLLGVMARGWAFFMRQVQRLLRWARLEEAPQGVDATVHQLITLIFIALFLQAAVAVAMIQYQTYDIWLPGAGVVGACVFVLQMALIEQYAERISSKDKARRRESWLWFIGAAACVIASVLVTVTAQANADGRRVAEARAIVEKRDSLKMEIDELKMAPEMYAMSSVEKARLAYYDMGRDRIADGRTIQEACVTPTRATLQDCARYASARAGIADARKRQDTEEKIAAKESELKLLVPPDASDLDVEEVQRRRLFMSLFIEIVMGIAVAFVGWRRGTVTDAEAAARAARVAAGASSQLNAAAARAEAAAAALTKANEKPIDSSGIPTGVWVDLGGGLYRTPAGIEMTMEQIDATPGLMERLQASVRQGQMRKA